MVGREADLGSLLEAVVRADTGEAQVALVRGEAGIGKTRLVRELVSRVPDDTVVVYGHAVPLASGSLPYGLAGDLLRALVREVHIKVVEEALGSRTAFLAPLVPKLGPAPDARLDRLALYAATQDLLADLATDRTLVLVVEDLHWVDQASLDLVTFWARTLVRGRLMLVVTTRDQGADEKLLARVSELRRLPNTTVLELEPLSAQGVEAQVRSLDETAGPDLVADIQRLSDGNPLFVEELVAGGGRGPSTSLSLDLAGSLGALSPESAEVLRTAAMEPRTFAVETLVAVADGPKAVVEQALDEGSRHGLVDRDLHGLWSFRHELLRQAVLASSPPSVGVSAHRRWAEALSAPGADADDLVSAAGHRETLGAPAEALAAHLRAARAIADAMGPQAARHEWRRVLGMLQVDASLAPESVYEDALLAAGGADLLWSEQMRIVEAEEQVAHPAPPVRRAWTRLTRFCASRSVDGVSAPELSVDEILRLRSMLAAESPRRATLACLHLLVRACNASGARGLRDETVELIDQMPVADQRRLAHSKVNVMEWRLVASEERRASPVEDRRIIDEALVYYDLLDSDLRAHVQMRLAEVLQRQGHLTRAAGEADQAVRLLHGPEVGGFLWPVAESIALDVLFLLGRWDEVADRVERVIADRDHVEAHNAALALAALVRAAQGRVDEALDNIALLDPVVMAGHDGTTGYMTRHFPRLIEAAGWATREPVRARTCLLPFLGGPGGEAAPAGPGLPPHRGEAGVRRRPRGHGVLGARVRGCAEHPEQGRLGLGVRTARSGVPGEGGRSRLRG